MTLLDRIVRPVLQQPSHGGFPALDGLRAVAVLAVVVTHAAFWTGRYERGPGVAILARMDVGVAVFFVISGFLLVRPWLVAASRDHGAMPSLKVYAARRVARILPAYWVAVTAAMVLLPRNREKAEAIDWVRHLTLTQIYRYGWVRDGLTQTWSLCTEVAFYAVLPLLGLLVAWLVVRRGGWSPWPGLAVAAALALIPLPWYKAIHPAPSESFLSAPMWLPGYLGWFAAGMALAVVEVHLSSGHAHPSSRWWLAEDLARHPFTCWAVSAAFLVAALSTAAGPRAVGETSAAQAVIKSYLYLGFAAALVWPAVMGRSRPVMTALANAPMRYLGDISYGVFLYHLVVLEGVMNLLGNPVFGGSALPVLLLTLAGTIPLAALSYRYLELPIIRAARRKVRSPERGRRRRST
ncbi:MAG: acyltransferase [Micrococcales bacterium]|nr:acyltransferase [Micrococcales bacterium]